jgi:methionine biosynthesis protein MetW
MMNATCIDFQIISGLVPTNAKVLDLGCGTGDLLQKLTQEKKISGQGIDLNEKAIYECVEKGLTVFHGDIESGLGEYPDKSFDVVILNQSIQEIKNLRNVFSEALRVGWRVIVGFPNFAFIQSRIQIFLYGKTPVAKHLPYPWHNTPNVHFFTILDFEDYCENETITVLSRHFFHNQKIIRHYPNLFASHSIYELTQAPAQLLAHAAVQPMLDGAGI